MPRFWLPESSRIHSPPSQVFEATLTYREAYPVGSTDFHKSLQLYRSGAAAQDVLQGCIMASHCCAAAAAVNAWACCGQAAVQPSTREGQLSSRGQPLCWLTLPRTLPHPVPLCSRQHQPASVRQRLPARGSDLHRRHQKR